MKKCVYDMLSLPLFPFLLPFFFSLNSKMKMHGCVLLSTHVGYMLKIVNCSIYTCPRHENDV
jgi:hypothetical protein